MSCGCTVFAGEIVIEMVDGSDILPPLPAEPGNASAALTLADVDAATDPAQLEAGRGLLVVTHLAWGRCGARPTTTCTTDPPKAGKAIWFAIEAPASLAEHRARSRQ